MRWGRRHRRNRHHIGSVWFAIGNVAVGLIENGVTLMDFTLDVGKTENLGIVYKDENGQVMSPAPTPDLPPAWAQTSPASDTLTAAADGNSATALGLAAGIDTIQMTVVVGGTVFVAVSNATINAVAPPAPVLTSVEISATPA